MNLAEALILRADAQKRVEQLRHRINNSALVQEGETPLYSVAQYCHTGIVYCHCYYHVLICHRS